jgi:large subunit ribosomal protein L4
MFKARYYKADGKKGKARELPETLFDGVVNESVLHQAVKVYLANQRQGTAAAKNRSEVRGGSRKPWRQKGTGRARQGTIRAAQWTGGGMAFPPQPHSWRQKLPRKVRDLAHRSAFNVRAEEERVILVEAFQMEAPKTAQLRDYLAGIEAGKKVVILTNGKNETLYLSSRNMQNVIVREFGSESVYDLLWATDVVIEKDALDALGAAEKEATDA